MVNKKYPIIFENSKVPYWLNKILPFKIGAISFFLFVFSLGKPTERTVRHETIHYLQQKELFFVGQWVLYAYYYLKTLIKTRDSYIAYRNSPFEMEAYSNDRDINYLEVRPKFAWKKYVT